MNTLQKIVRARIRALRKNKGWTQAGITHIKRTTSHLVSGFAVWASDAFFWGRATVTKSTPGHTCLL